MKFLTIILLVSLTNSGIIFGQSDSSGFVNPKRIMSPGKQYKAGALHNFFFGEHWRSLWTTSISIEEINLNKFGGGLTPVKKGGGLQTKSLRLRGGDGNEYKFRLIDKNPVSSLPVDLQKSIYADIIQDQVSIGIPVSSLIAYPLMKDVEILSPEPKIIFMPDANVLGIFKKDFGGKAGIIEINPRAGKKGVNNFANAEKVINGFEIFEKTEKDNDERVDQIEFLKARLMDIFIGDRDRHADQWQWAGYKNNGVRIWKPIPRDRDYAFARYDGLFPTISGLLTHSLVSFGKDYPSLLELTWSGRHLDRRFLNSIDKKSWDSVAVYLQNKLTDESITNAVRQLPSEMFAKEGKNLIQSLKSRRDKLKDASDEFYKVYSEVVDVYGSNKREITEIKFLNEKEVDISLYKKDKETGKKKGEPFYKRKFNSDYTNEVRLHLLDGDDNVKVSGKTDNDILIRIETGKGKDKIINPSGAKIKLYDEDKNTKITSQNNIYYNDDLVKPGLTQIDKYEPVLEDRYGFYAITPVLNYNTDDGYILGGGPNFTKFGFRADPYLYYLELTGAYATTAKDYDFRFYGDFNKLIHNSRVQFFLKASELDFNRFYGFGNETVRNENLAGNNFYKTNQKDFSFEPKVSLNLYKKLNLDINAVFKYSDIKINTDELVGFLNPYGTGLLSTFGIGAGFSFDNKDNLSFPEKGQKINFNATYFPKIFNNKNNFGKLSFDVINYQTFNPFTKMTLVLRASSELLLGNYPFYYGAFLGGLKNLRGYPRERFLGDAEVSGQSELRVYIATVNLFIPAKVGISAIGDVGRVFLKGEDSKKWHSTYGGGVWLNLLNTFTVNFIVALSPEVTKYYFSTGFTL